jgi:hypothetical protein
MSQYYESIGVSGELLTADDVAGICAIYPASSTPLECVERAPAYDTCKHPGPLDECSLATKRHTSSGCSIGPVGRDASNPPFVLGLAMSLASVARRRRQVRA